MYNSKEKSWSRGLVKSRLKNGRESRSRETEVGEKIAATSDYIILFQKYVDYRSIFADHFMYDNLKF